jgi:CrcB protein
VSRPLSLNRQLCAVLCGGFCGTITRYWLSQLIQAHLGKGWPYDIFLINITGALLLAFITTLADETFLIGPTRRLFINVGFLGAYTTFSSLALGGVQLATAGHWLSALSYLFISLAVGILAVWCGDMLGQWIINYKKTFAVVKSSLQESNMLSLLSLGKQQDHIDVQDDLLLDDEDEARIPR